MDLKLCGGCGWALALNRYIVDGKDADFLECENSDCDGQPQRVVFHVDGSFTDYVEAAPAPEPVEVGADEEPEDLMARVFVEYEPVEILRRAMLACDRAEAVDALIEFDLMPVPSDECGTPFGWGDGEDDDAVCTLDHGHEGLHGDGEHEGVEVEKEPIRL